MLCIAHDSAVVSVLARVLDNGREVAGNVEKVTLVLRLIHLRVHHLSEKEVLSLLKGWVVEIARDWR